MSTISIPERMTAAFPHLVFMLMRPMIRPNGQQIRTVIISAAIPNPVSSCLRGASVRRGNLPGLRRGGSLPPARGRLRGGYATGPPVWMVSWR